MSTDRFNLLIEKVESSDLVHLILDYSKTFNKKEHKMFDIIERFLKTNDIETYKKYLLKTPYYKTLFFRNNFFNSEIVYGEYYCICGTPIKTGNIVKYKNSDKKLVLGNDCNNKFFLKYLSKKDIHESEKKIAKKNAYKRCKKQGISSYKEKDINGKVIASRFFIEDVRLSSITKINGKKTNYERYRKTLDYEYQHSMKYQPLCPGNTNKHFFNQKCNLQLCSPNIEKIKLFNKIMGYDLITSFKDKYYLSARFDSNIPKRFNRNTNFNIEFHVVKSGKYYNPVFKLIK